MLAPDAGELASFGGLSWLEPGYLWGIDPPWLPIRCSVSDLNILGSVTSLLETTLHLHMSNRIKSSRGEASFKPEHA